MTKPQNHAGRLDSLLSVPARSAVEVPAPPYKMEARGSSSSLTPQSPPRHNEIGTTPYTYASSTGTPITKMQSQHRHNTCICQHS